jgi:3'-phosphoadenosine 5'-phosphosulfate (PAPS) 3'-phosphatase
VEFATELDAAVAAAIAGGNIVSEFYEKATARTYEKGDGSPVTDADMAADRVISTILRERIPQVPILTEEGDDDATRLNSKRCWIVDPVDGTEQFIKRTGEFDVLVALVEGGRPVAVAGYQPTTRTLVTATRGGGAWVTIANQPSERIVFSAPGPQLRIATSKWFGAPGNAGILREVASRLGTNPAPMLDTGFSPRMFLAPRAFDAMIGVRDGEDQTMASEWDFAVADLVIAEAGGLTTDIAGRPFQYNKQVPTNNGGLVAAISPSVHDEVLQALRAELDDRGF